MHLFLTIVLVVLAIFVLGVVVAVPVKAYVKKVEDRLMLKITALEAALKRKV